MSRILQPFLTNLIKNFEASKEFSSKPTKKGNKDKKAKCPSLKPVYRSKKLEKLACSSTCPVNTFQGPPICPDTGKKSKRLSHREKDDNEITLTGLDGKKVLILF